MEHYKNLLIKVQTFDIKIIEKKDVDRFLDISHENPSFSCEFKNKLKELKSLALTDLLMLDPETAISQLKQIESLKLLFGDFWSKYYDSKEPHSDNERKVLFYSLNLDNAFIVSDIYNVGYNALVKQNFINDLYDSVLAREEILSDLKDTVEMALNLKQCRIETSLLSEITKPSFVTEQVIFDFFSILNPYFTKNDGVLFLDLIHNRVKEPTEPLLFLGNGNQLADAFKQLFDANLIVGCTKIELQNWIHDNFRYKDGNHSKRYTLKYLSDVISSNTKPCQSPIMDVVKRGSELILVNTLKRSN